MPPVDPTIVLSQFLGSLPTFIAVILAWMYSNKRIDDLRSEAGDVRSQFQSETKDLRGEVSALRSELSREFRDFRGELRDLIKSESALIRSELRRVEEVMDARLKHLEER